VQGVRGTPYAYTLGARRDAVRQVPPMHYTRQFSHTRCLSQLLDYIAKETRQKLPIRHVPARTPPFFKNVQRWSRVYQRATPRPRAPLRTSPPPSTTHGYLCTPMPKSTFGQNTPKVLNSSRPRPKKYKYKKTSLGCTSEPRHDRGHPLGQVPFIQPLGQAQVHVAVR